MKGKFYGIGVGPGDKELITLKAIKTLEHCDCIAIPKAEGKQSTAFQIAKEYIKEDCTVLEISFKMTRDKTARIESRWEAVEEISAVLEKEKNVCFLTLGDPTIYSTCMYLCSGLKEKGFCCEIIPGVSSFCAMAARLGVSIAEEDENFAVLAMTEDKEILKRAMKEFDNLVLMKAAKHIALIQEVLKEEGLKKEVIGITKCGMKDEEIFYSLEEAREKKLNYFTTLLCKEKGKEKWYQS